MDQNKVLAETVNSIFEEGIDFYVKYDKPGILRRIGLLPKERQFIIHPIKLGTLIRISKEILSIDTITPPEKSENAIDLTIKIIASNTDKLVKIIAMAIVNSPAGTSRLEKFIRQNMTAREMYQLLTIIVQQMDVKDFLSSIMSVRGMSLLKTGE